MLDTNIVVSVLNGEQSIWEEVRRREVLVSVITVGELRFGALNSGRSQANLRRAEEFLCDLEILDCDPLTADEYAKIANLLKNKGRPIPDNDVWIAATAVQHGLTLVSKDKHFSAVDGLYLEIW